MQDGATAQCSGEMGHRIRAEHQGNPVVPRRGACRRCQLLCGSRIRQILTHQSSPGECASPGTCSRGLVSPPNVWVAVPFEQELGTRQTNTERCRKRIEQELEKEPEGASRVARDRERIKRARHEERARDMRVVDPEQRPDREVTEGTGASSSRDGAGNEQEAT